MTHLQFQAELCDQLCHPGKRERIAERASPRRPPPTGTRDPPGKKARKSLNPSPEAPGSEGSGRGKALVSMLGKTEFHMDKRLRVIALSKGSSHPIAEVPGKVTCQMCYYRWVKKGRSERNPQTMARILCVPCNHAVCSPQCFNELHGLAKWE